MVVLIRHFSSFIRISPSFLPVKSCQLSNFFQSILNEPSISSNPVPLPLPLRVSAPSRDALRNSRWFHAKAQRREEAKAKRGNPHSMGDVFAGHLISIQMSMSPSTVCGKNSESFFGCNSDTSLKRQRRKPLPAGQIPHPNRSQRGRPFRRKSPHPSPAPTPNRDFLIFLSSIFLSNPHLFTRI